MLFNSYPFLFVFLPVTLAGFFLIARASHTLAAGWLTLASLAFYGWWNPAYVGLLALSIAFNFAVGAQIARRAGADRAAAKRWLAFGVAVDLALLGYYKYTGFLLGNWKELTGAGVPVPDIALPLGISFFTFTQIAFLADAYQGLVREYRPVHYALFVTYYPHLIAGPVLHHKEMMPQFGHAATYRWDWENLAVRVHRVLHRPVQEDRAGRRHRGVRARAVRRRRRGVLELAPASWTELRKDPDVQQRLEANISRRATLLPSRERAAA